MGCCTEHPRMGVSSLAGLGGNCEDQQRADIARHQLGPGIQTLGVNPTSVLRCHRKLLKLATIYLPLGI